MNRLTEKEQDYYRLKDYQDPCRAIDKLGKYEDIGFSPEELQEKVDRQKWHVVAEGDLPPKPKDGIKRYLVTKQRQNDWSKRIVTALYWDGNDFYNDGLSGSRIRYVLAWRELPEPWEGAVK